MAIPSEKYVLTPVTGFTNIFQTADLSTIFPNANDRFDKSIFYTSPVNNDYIFNNLMASVTPVEVASTFEIPYGTGSSTSKFNQYKIKPETFGTTKLYFCATNSTATGNAYYQTGISEDDKSPRKTNYNVSAYANFNTKDIEFYPVINARVINEDGSLSDAVETSLNRIYEEPDKYVIQNFKSFRYYGRTDTGSKTLSGEPCVFISDDNINGFASLKNFIEERTWSMQFGGAHSESGKIANYLYKLIPTKPYDYNIPDFQIPDYPMWGKESEVDSTELVYKTIAENDTWILQGRWSLSYRSGTEKEVSGITYQTRACLKGKAFLKILAHLGIYIRSNSSAFSGVDENLYIGYMNTDGTTTGELLRGEAITNSDTKNKDYNTSNSDYNPDKKGGDEDDPWDKINFGPGGGNLGVFAKFYLCTATDLANLRSWFAGGGHQQIPEGFDPMTQIIGLSQFATSVSGTAVDEAEITFRAADNSPVYTGVFCQRGSGADLAFDLGSIQIPLRMKDRGVPFLDYSSTVELYIPFCGTFQLDPQTVLGRTVAVRMWMSTTTGECFAIATADGAPVAYGSGNMSAEMPISSSGWGMYKAQLTGLNAKIAGGNATAFAQGASAAVNGIIAAEGALGGGAAGAVAGVEVSGLALGTAAAAAALPVVIAAGVAGAQQIRERNHAKNSNTTAVSGSLSSTAAWHQPFTPYIKITRPHYRKPDNYAHTQAIPLVATRTLSECAGLTMCIGTDLSSLSATEMEKQAIQTYLSAGVIV